MDNTGEVVNYAVETLEIELNRIKMLLRKIDAICIENMCNLNSHDEYIKKQEDIIKAIKYLTA